MELKNIKILIIKSKLSTTQMNEASTQMLLPTIFKKLLFELAVHGELRMMLLIDRLPDISKLAFDGLLESTCVIHQFFVVES